MSFIISSILADQKIAHNNAKMHILVNRFIFLSYSIFVHTAHCLYQSKLIVRTDHVTTFSNFEKN